METLIGFLLVVISIVLSLSRSKSIWIKAIPISFVGGFLMFFKLGGLFFSDDTIFHETFCKEMCFGIIMGIFVVASNLYSGYFVRKGH